MVDVSTRQSLSGALSQHTASDHRDGLMMIMTTGEWVKYTHIEIEMTN